MAGKSPRGSGYGYGYGDGDCDCDCDGNGDEIFCGIDFFHVLPEGCIAVIISFTSPRDACRLASVSKIFKSAADSDQVWERFLPSDYRDVLHNSVGGLALLNSLSKKQLYLHLSEHQLLDHGGTKSFSLERLSGKKCYTIGAKELGITWGDTPRYWTWRSAPESRFPELAELVTVCWLEIVGKMNTNSLSPDTNYAAYLVFKMSEEAYGFYSPAEVSVKTAGGKSETRTVYLDRQEGQNQRNQIIPRRIGVFNRVRHMTGIQPAMQREGDLNVPKQRADGWLEVEIGEFWTQRDEDEEVEMSVKEVKAGNWKGGVIVEGIEVRPKPVTA